VWKLLKRIQGRLFRQTWDLGCLTNLGMELHDLNWVNDEWNGKCMG